MQPPVFSQHLFPMLSPHAWKSQHIVKPYIMLYYFFLQEIIKIPKSSANEHPARSQKKHECNCGIIYCISGNYHLSMLK
jgi:hypothetical protein